MKISHISNKDVIHSTKTLHILNRVEELTHANRHSSKTTSIGAVFHLLFQGLY